MTRSGHRSHFPNLADSQRRTQYDSRIIGNPGRGLLLGAIGPREQVLRDPNVKCTDWGTGGLWLQLDDRFVSECRSRDCLQVSSLRNGYGSRIRGYGV